jgi:hypothetical protein
MSTVFSYNGITIPYPKTTDVSDEPVYENGDYLYTKWTFRIEGVVFTGAYGGSEAAPTAFARIEHYLEQPRKRLTYTINGVKILDVAATAGVTGIGDVANGPLPEVLSIFRVDGGAAIWVSFRVTAHVRNCPGGPTQTYLSNRWQETLTIDDECRTTRTRQGDIILRSDFGAAPDSFRGLVTPPIPNGFLRESSSYQLQKDGLRIQYQFVDREVYILPPRGTFKAAATYKETCTTGAVRHAEVNASIVGDFRSNRRDLLALAVTIAVQRLNRSGIARNDKSGRWLATGAFEENLYEPKVAVSIRAMLKPGPAISDGKGKLVPSPALNNPGAFAGVPGIPAGRLEAVFPRMEGVNAPGKPSVINGGWGMIPFGSDGTSPDPGVRGTAGLRLLAAALNDPCLNQTVLNATLSGGTGSASFPVLLPQNQDPASSSGGGAGATNPPPDPFFNPDGFIRGGG